MTDPDNKDQIIKELASLVRGLCRHVAPHYTIRTKALDYLRRHDLMGNILRKEQDLD